MPNELEPLRFSAGKRVQRLTEPQITEAHFLEDRERLREPLRLADPGKEFDRLAHGQFEQIVNRAPLQFDLQDMRLKAAAFAFRATHVKIAQKLHLDFFETGSAATLTPAAARVEGKSAGCQALRHRFRQRGEKLAHTIVNSEVKNRRRPRRAREWRLIDHYDFTDAMRAGDALAGAGFVSRESACAQQISVEHLMNEGRFSRAGNAGHAGENA